MHTSEFAPTLMKMWNRYLAGRLAMRPCHIVEAAGCRPSCWSGGLPYRCELARTLQTLFVAGLALSFAASPVSIVCAEEDPIPSEGNDQKTSLKHVLANPKGLNASDWSNIRQEYERHRHDMKPVDGGFEARSPSQQWSTRFDGRGFITRPNEAGWQWGLELRSYGFKGQEKVISEQEPEVRAQDARLTYGWDNNLQEWFLNDTVGLEHGFTVKNRPAAGSSPDSQRATLDFLLAVRGNLRPEVQTSGTGVNFVDRQGNTAVTYAGLAVLDADGRKLRARFEVTAAADVLRLSIEEKGARYPLTIDPVAQQAYVKASNTEAGDAFGSAVTISGDTVVVGAWGEDSSATGVNSNQFNNNALDSGAAYVFVRNGATWTQQAYLKASNTESVDYFGFSVSISGDTVVIGAWGEDSVPIGDAGATYVFVRSGTNWSQQAFLKGSNTQTDDRFGYSVAVSGDTLVVGAYLEDSNATGVNGDGSNNSASGSGAAYVFIRDGTNWVQQAFLKASNTETDDHFGETVSISADTVVVGAADEDSNATGVNGDGNNNSAGLSGAAYVFVRSGTNWLQQAYLKASNAEAGDAFGGAVAAAGDTVVVGADFEDSNATGVNGDSNNNSGSGSGAAYVFVRDGTNWSQQAYLKASNTGAGDRFGIAVAAAGDSVLVGAWGESSSATGVDGDGNNNNASTSGAAYLFTRSGTIWSQRAYLKASNTEANDYFGKSSVAISGDTMIVGAEKEDSFATGVNGSQGNGYTDSGAAYIYAIYPCIPAGISQQPTNQTVCSGSAVSFSVSATGYSPTYQWRRNGVNLTNGPTDNGSTISGATSATLTLTPTKAGDAADAGSGYDCVITVACDGSITNSDRVALVVNLTPAIFAVTGGGGGCSNPGVPVGLSNSEIGMDYLLRTNGVFNGVVVAGTGSAISFGNQILARTYTVQASNTLGGCTALMSGSAVVTILTPAAITNGPAPAAVLNYEGGAASFSVSATGSGLAYQWQRDGTNLTNGGRISGATSSNLNIATLSTNDTTTVGHSYRCVVSGSCGAPQLSGEAVLTVLPENWVSVPGVSGGLSAVAVDGAGNLYIGGVFSTVAGVSATNIAKWDGTNWSALGAGLNAGVRALVVSGNDVYAGGPFTNAGGAPANYIAKWDGTNWSALGSGMNNQVLALAVSGADLYAGGQFTTAGGSSANYVAKWNGSSWSALGSGTSTDVRSLATSGSNLYVGGTFTSAGGVIVNYVAKWNGTSWSALGSGVGGGSPNTVYAIVVSSNDVYVGGRFTTAGGNPASSAARWNGTTWTGLGSGINGVSGYPVYALAISGSDLYAGGFFNTAGGMSAKNIAMWNGTNWVALGAGTDSSVTALASSAGALYVAGDFNTAGTKASARLAKWLLAAKEAANNPPLVSTPIPDANGLYGTPFNFTFAADTYSDPDAGQTLSYTAGGLPAGITFTPGTRTFSGTPTAVGTNSVTVTATDNGTPQLSTNDVFDIVIAKASLTVTANNTNRPFGAANPSFTGSLIGVVNSDNITALFSTTADANTPPGNYPIVPTLVDPDGKLINYTVTTNLGTLTINPVTLGFTLSSNSPSFCWPTNAAAFVLEYADSLAPSVVWKPLTNNIAVNGASLCYVETNRVVSTRFYRLRLQ